MYFRVQAGDVMIRANHVKCVICLNSTSGGSISMTSMTMDDTTVNSSPTF